MRMLTFAAGLAAGYVLGTRAGREKYEQIAAGARQVRANPTLGQVQETIKDVLATPKPATVGSDFSGGAPEPARRRTVAATPAPATAPATAVPATPLP